MTARASVLAALLVLGTAGAAHAQIFLGSHPDPQLTVGPLFVTARVTPELGDVAIDVLWGLNPPAHRSAAEFEQTVYLLWPGEIAADPSLGKANPALNRYVEERGFIAVDEGRIALSARAAYQLETDVPPERIPAGASFVTFVRQGGALGLTSPATYISVPWHPKMANRAWLMNLQFRARGLLKPKPATWLESTFWGRRHRFELTFNDMRPRGIFPLYFENRDRALRLADDPSQLVMLFTQAGQLKVDEIAPGSAARRRHESLEQTEAISRFLEVSEGMVPQTLTVQFGYFSALHSWAPVLIPIVFFVLGNVLRPPLQSLGAWLGRTLKSRLAISRRAATPERQTGVVLSREQVARIVPGRTTREEVLALTPAPPEEFEQLHEPDQRTLIFRGRRDIPRRTRRYGWVTTVGAWDIEHHEVEVVLDHDVVKSVQARVRHTEQVNAQAGS